MIHNRSLRAVLQAQTLVDSPLRAVLAAVGTTLATVMVQTMSEEKENTYLVCTRRKGQPKKHIEVCHKCRWRGSCKPFQEHCQPGLPLAFKPDPAPETPAVPKATLPRPPVPPSTAAIDQTAPPPADGLKALLRHIQRELEEIRRLC